MHRHFIHAETQLLLWDSLSSHLLTTRQWCGIKTGSRDSCNTYNHTCTGAGQERKSKAKSKLEAQCHDTRGAKALLSQSYSDPHQNRCRSRPGLGVLISQRQPLLPSC